jgi:peptide/nickel transport system substrate-binding protein
MLSTDKNGNIVSGYDYDCAALAYSVVTHGSQEAYNLSNDYADYYTEYYFALKNGVKFSNGATLSIQDVLFNLYTLLDPSYTGSSTLYSVNIQGLKAYRAQTYNEGEQDAMDDYFATLAENRIAELTTWCSEDSTTLADLTDSMKEVIAKAEELFKEELTSDWATADSSSESYEKYGFTETWQIYLYMEGLVTVKSEKNKDANGEWVTTYEVDYNGYDAANIDHSKEAMIQTVYDANMSTSVLSTYKTKLKAVVAGGWATASSLSEYFKSVCISDYFSDSSKIVVPNISGITASRATTIPGESGDIALGEECDILKIVVNGVDPKAIYNFSFTVAPMSYYSTAEEIAKFSIEDNHFGVAFADQSFFEQLQKKLVPVGAGPYKASNVTATCTDESIIPTKNEFYANNIVYYERNNNFYTVFGNDTSKNAKIKKVRYKVIATDQMFAAVTGASADVLYSEPQATSDNMTKIASMSGVGYSLADNLGYGYIGINAKYVNDINVRRAIMYCLDTGLCLDYYGGSSFASILYRSMSSNSWAYPTGCLPYYAEYSYECTYDDAGNVIAIGSFDDEKAKASALAAVNEAGYTLDASTGKLTNSKGETLTFTFTIAGDSTAHPAYQTLQKAATLLNSIGFDITVTKDANALSKLSTGSLQVWAAAWSSTIDPDMYQVYHKDSSATSIKNWGFPWMQTDGTSYENDLLDELALLIEDARATVDQNTRTELYAEALDIVMELAVECATYQRKNLYIWNSNLIDSSTLCEATAYQSPLSRIWEVSFVQGK